MKLKHQESGSGFSAAAALVAGIAVHGCGTETGSGNDGDGGPRAAASSGGSAAIVEADATVGAQADPATLGGGAGTAGSAGAAASFPTAFAGASGAEPGGSGPGEELGPCGHPAVTFRINAAPGTDLCAAALFVNAGVGTNTTLWGLEPWPSEPDEVTFLPSEGLALVWDGRVQVYAQNCSNGPAGECTEDAELVCLSDDPDLQAAWPRNAAGQYTIAFQASPVSPRGTCAPDVMSIDVAFELDAGGDVSVDASDFELTPVAGTFTCGSESCDAATDYCEERIEVVDGAAEQSVFACVEYPDECIDDHMCECLQPYLEDGLACTDRGMASVAHVVGRVE